MQTSVRQALLRLGLIGCVSMASCAVKLPEERRAEREAAAKQAEPAAEEPVPVVTTEPPMKREPVRKAPNFLRADGTRIVDSKGRPVTLKGCNLGNWLLLEMWMLDMTDLQDQHEFESILAERFGPDVKDQMMETYRRNWINEKDFEIIRSFRFNTVRLPFNYRLLEDDEKPFQLRPEAFRWLDYAVDLARKHNLWVILDMHGVPGGQSNDHTTGRKGQNQLWTSEANQKRTAWLWQKIAEHYAESATVAAYDIINEPYGVKEADPTGKLLVDVADRIYRSIRAVDTNHLVFFPGTQEGIEFYDPPAARGWENAGFTEHFYPGLFGQELSRETHSHFIARDIPWRMQILEKLRAPFLVGEFNVVYGHVGGAALMRKYYDLYATNGWAATMWAYKLIKNTGEMPEDTWCMVKNKNAISPVSVKTSTREEIDFFLNWLGNRDYAFYENLGAALTMVEAPPAWVADVPILPTEPPARDPLPGWEATDIGGATAGGQKVHSPTAFDIYGGGTDLWATNDQFRFVWKPVIGDFDLGVCVTNLVESHLYAKAGLMIRGSLDDDAPLFLIHAFPSGKVYISWRPNQGDKLDQKELADCTMPLWLRIKRRGNMLEASCSTDRRNWTKTKVQLSAGIGLQAHVGFAVLSHEGRYLTTASFSDIMFASAQEDGKSRGEPDP